MPAGSCKIGQRLHLRQVLVAEYLRTKTVAAPASLRMLLPSPILPRKQPICQRKIGNKSQACLHAFRQNAGFWLAVKQVVVILNADESRAGAGRGLRLFDLTCRKVRAPDLADLPCPHQFVQRAERVRQRRRRVRLMELVQIDAIGAKPSKTILDSLPDVGRLGALALLVKLHSELCGEHNLRSPVTQRLAEKFFALASAVNVGRVQKIDSRIQGGVYNRARRLRVDTPPEVIASQSDNRDFQRSNPSLLHGSPLYGFLNIETSPKIPTRDGAVRTPSRGDAFHLVRLWHFRQSISFLHCRADSVVSGWEHIAAA